MKEGLVFNIKNPLPYVKYKYNNVLMKQEKITIIKKRWVHQNIALHIDVLFLYHVYQGRAKKCSYGCSIHLEIKQMIRPMYQNLIYQGCFAATFKSFKIGTMVKTECQYYRNFNPFIKGRIRQEWKA